jgi:hypothetical protein
MNLRFDRYFYGQNFNFIFNFNLMDLRFDRYFYGENSNLIISSKNITDEIFSDSFVPKLFGKFFTSR